MRPKAEWAIDSEPIRARGIIFKSRPWDPCEKDFISYRIPLLRTAQKYYEYPRRKEAKYNKNRMEQLN